MDIQNIINGSITKKGFETYCKCHGVERASNYITYLNDKYVLMHANVGSLYLIYYIEVLNRIKKEVENEQGFNNENDKTNVRSALNKYISYVRLNTISEDEKDLFDRVYNQINNAKGEIYWDKKEPNFDDMFAEDGFASIRQTFTSMGMGAKQKLKNTVRDCWNKINQAICDIKIYLEKEEIDNARKQYENIQEIVGGDYAVIHRLIAGRIPEFFTDIVVTSRLKETCGLLGIEINYKAADWFQMSMDLYHKFNLYISGTGQSLNDRTSYRRIGWLLYTLGVEMKAYQEDLAKFKYKKAMMLYGPPGTGKTYEAMKIAKSLIEDIYTQNNVKLPVDVNENIFHLQLHVNYTYNDFIAGKVISNGKIELQRGYIFDVIDKANIVAKTNNELPVVVILDEINRTDISRVFGELFSAIERRGEDIDLTIRDNNGKPLKLNIPNNVYFIGTMNEIDFSLERIDFALRRRFIWILKTYDETALKEILNMRMGGYSFAIQDLKVDDFVSKCTKLNDQVKKDLGEEYSIGHAFFAEIVNIMGSLNLKYDDAVKMLWDISIEPTINAYCGNMEQNERNDLVKKCKEALNVKD